MLRKIILENFMSHGRTEIELADGLTVLTGPNNCGKSAVVAALQILATNGRTTHVTRHGEKTCRITVETDDGHTVVWERKGTTVKYTLDGEDIHRLGGSVPHQLHDLLRLDRVEADTGKSTHEYDIHFGEQKSPVFLLGETGSRAASFFASSTDASRLVEMQHRHRSNVADQKKQVRRLAEEKENNEQRLITFAPLEVIAKSVSKAQSIAADIESNEKRIETLRDLAGRLGSVTESKNQRSREQEWLSKIDQTKTTPYSLQNDADQHDQLNRLIERTSNVEQRTERLRQQNSIFGTLQPTPEFQPAKRCKSLIGQAKTLTKRIHRDQTAQQALSQLESPPPVQDVKSLHSLLRRIRELAAKQVAAAKTIGVVGNLTGPPNVNTTSRLQTTIVLLRSKSSQICGGLTAAKTFDRLKPADDPVSSVTLTTTIECLRSNASSVALAKRSAIAAIKAIEACEAELRAFVAENPTCQTCGASIDPETLMSVSHGVHHHQGKDSVSRGSVDG